MTDTKKRSCPMCAHLNYIESSDCSRCGCNFRSSWLGIMKHVTEHRDAEAQQRVIDEANTEYALAEALRRCLELAREGTRLESVAGSNGWHQVGRLQARLDAIVTVADLTLAAYGLEDKHAD